MATKPVVPRERANCDIEEVLAWYRQEAGAETALGFVLALEKTYAALAGHPGIGSPRHAHELNLPELRHRKVGKFPYLVFYVERDGHVDVWRVLGVHRDIPAWLAEAER